MAENDFDVGDFLSMMEVFSKEKYKKTFESISRYIYRSILSIRGRQPTIHNKNKIDRIIKKQIDKNIIVETGYFHDKVPVGAKVVYNDCGVKIVAKIIDNGFLEIIPSECDFEYKEAIINNKFVNMPQLLERWNKGEGVVYSSPIEIIKDAKNLQRIRNKNEIIKKFTQC